MITMNPRNIVADLVSRGHISYWCGDVLPGVIESGEWDLCAFCISFHLPDCFVYRSGRKITVMYGNKTVMCLMGAEEYALGARARSIVTELICQDAPYSIGGATRKALRWVGSGSYTSESAERLMDGVQYGHHHRIPGSGVYGTLFDLDSCYYSLLKRLPSPVVRVDKAKIKFDTRQQRNEEIARWSYLMDAIGTDKAVRNCLWGVMLSGTPGKEFKRWKAGCVQMVPLRPSGWRTPAILVARMAWELCRDAAEQTDAMYSQTDCVISVREPLVWRNYGLSYGVRYSGEYNVVAQGCYRVGEHITKLYDRYQNGKTKGLEMRTVPVVERPGTVYYEQVLG